MQEENQENSSEKKGGVETTTLGELGPRLPIVENPEMDTEFSFKEWDMEMEETLSDLQSRSKNVGEFVRQMMDLLLDRYEGKDWSSYSQEEKLTKLSSMYFPNMMYVYMFLRVEELGHELSFESFGCPNCKKTIKDFVADLRTLEVVTKKGKENTLVDYELKKPILLNGQTITGLRIGVTNWGALEQIPAEEAGNNASLKKCFYQSSIRAALENGEPIEKFIDVKTLVKKIKKFDIERIGKTMTDNNGGPDMKIGGECPHCRTEFVKPIDWSYEIFFDSSSL